MSLERFWYETSPYLYAVLGAVMLLASSQTLGQASGGLLLATAAAILWLRWRNRHLPPAPARRAPTARSVHQRAARSQATRSTRSG